MKFYIFLIAAVLVSSAQAQRRAFPSEVDGLNIGNAHEVLPGKVFRGMNPLGKAKDLARFGITDVLIFKKETSNEVRTEESELRRAGITRIHKKPMVYANFSSEANACRMMIEGLQILEQVAKSSDRKIFFHCTHGEDRTGALAGLLRLLHEPKASIRDVFENDLCDFGYAEGNPNKPNKVNDQIHDELTPLFFKIANLIKSGRLTRSNLSTSVCFNLPEVDSRGAKCSASHRALSRK